MLSGDSVVGRLLRLGACTAPLPIAFALGVPICPFAIATGAPCPGCGMTRAAVALLRGDWVEAIALNPLAPFVVPLVAILFAIASIAYVRTGASVMRHPVAKWVGVATIIALNVVWVARVFGAFGGPVPV